METPQEIFCSAEWHLSHLHGQGSTLAPLIYSLSLRLSKKSGIFFASIPTLAQYFKSDERTIRKAIRILAAIKFFEIAREETGASVCYRPIHHSIWEKNNPGKCAEKWQGPWAKEVQDTLGPELHAISGGRFRVYPNWMKAMRKTGHSDNAIRYHFRAYIAQVLPTGQQWTVGLAGRFIKYLKAQSAGLTVGDPSQIL